MSLPRVASLETFLGFPGGSSSGAGADQAEGSRRGSISSVGTASLRARKITFNPLPESWAPGYPDNLHSGGGSGGEVGNDYQQQQSVGAFEVPQWKRIRE